MKVVCDCGNEMQFIINNDDICEDILEDNGDFVTFDRHKFDIWAEHDECGIECKICGKKIWMFP